MGRRRRAKKLTRTGQWLALLLIIGAVGSSAFVYLRWSFREQRYNKLIEEVSAQYGVDKFLVKAVMRQESSFDPYAYSSKGAVGLMQVMPPTAEDWARAVGRKDFTREILWRERTNIEAGCWYLARAESYWRRQGVDDPVPFMLAEYNAGRGNAQKWLPKSTPPQAAEFIAAITNAGVRRYVERVMEFREYYSNSGTL